MVRHGIPRVCFYSCPRNVIPSCFLFHWKVRTGIPRVYFYFGSTERNSVLFSFPLKGSEGNFESLLLLVFNGTEFRVVFSSTEEFGTEFRELSVPRNSRNSAGNNHLFRLFRLPRNYFLSDIPNPKCMSPRRNWDSPNPSLASEFALPPDRGEGATLTCGWGVGGVPIPTTGEKA